MNKAKECLADLERTKRDIEVNYKLLDAQVQGSQRAKRQEINERYDALRKQYFKN